MVSVNTFVGGKRAPEHHVNVDRPELAQQSRRRYTPEQRARVWLAAGAFDCVAHARNQTTVSAVTVH